MASTLFRNLRFCSFCKPEKLKRVLYCITTQQYEFSTCTQSVIGVKQSTEQKCYTDGSKAKYGILAVFTAFSLFLYSCKDKLKIPTGWIPTVHAIARNDSTLRQRFNFIADVVEKTADAVVCIESRTLLRNGVQSVAPGGSGFIVKGDGLILTNAHVVMNRPHRTVQVKLKDGRIFTGQIEDVDVNTDLATVRIKADKLPMIDLGSSSDLRAGEWVVAIGSPLSLRDSVSAGVVSSPQRKGEDLGINYKDMQYIQTDAAITFGNSGGPLVNLDGEAVGVNSMKVTAGISFAIPIEYAKDFLRRSEEKKKNEEDASILPSGKRRYIGVAMLTLTAELLHDLNLRNYQIPEFLENGILICQVMIGSPAFNSGVQPGDIIAEINGKPVSGVQSVYRALESGSPLNMKVFRRNVFLSVIIAPQEVV